MKQKMVLVKNVARLNEAGDALINRSPGMPGMGLVEGETGYGKTTAVTWFVNLSHGVYVRALAMWTPATMLTSILRELDSAPCSGSCGRMVEQIIESLSLSGRPLFLDEADYLIENKRMTETLRDLHDMASVPVILVGMGGIRQKLALRPQLSGRIAQHVEFKPCDLDDARKLARDLCDVEVADDLLNRLQGKTGGSIRHLVVGLSKIESAAKVRGLSIIGAKDWGQEDEFFLGEAAPKHQETRRKLKVVAA